MLSREAIEQEASADVSWVPVTKEDVARAAQSLRSGWISPAVNAQSCIRAEVELAAIVRLQAAAILKLGNKLDVFEGSALAAAIAAAPLHEITGYYYFDPDELLAHAVAYEATRRIEANLSAREVMWRWARQTQADSGFWFSGGDRMESQ
jgi:hypothetical protein